jgi:hypothetical protein
MMAEEWPIAAAPAGSAHASARDARRDRLSTVRADFFLNPAERLTEQERALMTAMLHCLVGDLADEIAAALPAGTTAATDDSNLGLIETLSAARLLDRPALVRLLLRRADEERISTAAKARSGRREARVLQGLVSHENGAIASAAMALILARGRRRDRFGQCLLDFNDLSTEEAAALGHAVAAALRPELVAVHPAGVSDRLLVDAVAQVLDGHEPANGIEALTAMLVALLFEYDELGDELIVAAAMEGEMTFVAQALGFKADLAGDIAMDELLSGDPARVMTIARIAGLGRNSVASLLAGIGDLLGINDPGRAISAFDAMSPADVEHASRWLGSDAAYRRAVAALGDS